MMQTGRKKGERGMEERRKGEMERKKKKKNPGPSYFSNN